MQLELCDRDIEVVSKQVPQIDQDSLIDIRFLKKGMFGHVTLVRVVGNHPRLRQNGSQYQRNRQRPLLFASKHINLNANDPEDAAKQLANEAIILSTLNHKNIIKLRAVCSGSFSKSFDKQSRGYFLLFDVLEETLQTKLERWRKEKRKTSDMCSKIYKKLFQRTSFFERYQKTHSRAQEASVIGIARGLAYLHSKQIVWRDVKPANIGYYRNDDCSSWTVKLIDFGMAQRQQDCIRGECCGSVAYMSPEVMRGERFTPKDDIFSFAVVLAEIYSLRMPYPQSRGKGKRMSNIERIDSIRKQVEEGLKPIENLDKVIHCPRIRDMIHECWGSPAQRPNSMDIDKRLYPILRLIKYDTFFPERSTLDATNATYDEEED
eukprot:CAMPEP_0116134304 /NCGR_PEP_ID=MMETSP0329-20121206/10573_1 /TAXON_ID=697910 /ORGANISM="Pseudo-nitzschia arenysensis, Strain B593" /LENGTH=376 /DNA_ID=CAMNT_0003629003 /DNA_START=527 /DNA_END=1657 /DNA_ORIENTATION=-